MFILELKEHLSDKIIDRMIKQFVDIIENDYKFAILENPFVNKLIYIDNNGTPHMLIDNTNEKLNEEKLKEIKDEYERKHTI